MSSESKYIPITFAPGVNRDTTPYGSEGTWYETDKVRWRNGFPQTIGGWQKESINEFKGVARTLTPWSTRQGDVLLALGTNSHLYIEKGGAFNDITPVSASTSSTDNLTVTSGETSVVVYDSTHGRLAGDYVVIESDTTLGGSILLEGESSFEISRVVDDNVYIINPGVTAASSETSGGGSVVIDYVISTGNQSRMPVFGYGVDGYGEGGYSEPGTTGALTPLRIWSIKPWGEDLLVSPNGRGLYLWDATDGVFTRATLVSTAPSVMDYMSIDMVSRQVVAYGTVTEVGSVYDPMLIRWSSSEDYTDWETLDTNTAGEFVLQDGSKITGIQSTKNETLIWTDKALISQSYIGTPDIYSFTQLGLGCGLIGRNASIDIGGIVFWMGFNGIWSYDGSVKPIPCTLQKDIFDYNGAFAVDRDQADKVFCGHNSQFKEVIWLYQSVNSTSGDCDRYVIYNYAEDIWYYGTLDRSAWLDLGLLSNPIACGTDNSLYLHELGLSNNNEPFDSSLVSAAFDIGEGDEVLYVDRIVPDFEIVGSVDVTLSFKNFPSSSEIEKGPYTFTSNTAYKDIRGRGRQMKLVIEAEAGRNSSWLLGKMRLRTKTNGRV